MEEDCEQAHNSSTTKIIDPNQRNQPSSLDRDEADLMRLGKRQVLKVSVDLFLKDFYNVDSCIAQIRSHFIAWL